MHRELHVAIVLGGVDQPLVEKPLADHGDLGSLAPQLRRDIT
jgi:hypothetical protein